MSAPDVHRTPMVRSDERMHTLDRDCWCNPHVLKVGAVGQPGNTTVDHQPENPGRLPSATIEVPS